MVRMSHPPGPAGAVTGEHEAAMGEHDAVDDVGDPEGGDPAAVDDAGDAGPRGLSWPRALALAAVLAFLGFAVGLFVARDRPPGEGSVEVGFYRDMITHHEQALTLAALELANGSDRTVREYAREVLTFQSYEIGVMRQSLREWGRWPAERSDEAMAWMGMPVPLEDMPGLLSDEQVDEMRAARGAEADALFLDLMAEHHLGAIHMASYAADEAGDGGVRELAGVMARNQAQEINEYRLVAEDKGFDIDIDPPPDIGPLPDL